MQFHEIQGNILEIPKNYLIVHCISGDMALGAGVALQIEQKFGCKKKLRQLAEIEGRTRLPVGRCYITDGVGHLVTKERYFHKPSIWSLEAALDSLCVYVRDNHIRQIAMPRIGCGLDRLDWSQVSRLIKDVFANVDVEIMVCYL